MNIFEDAILRLNQAAKIAEIDNEVLEELKRTKSILQVNIPVRMDDGTLQYFTGYRANIMIQEARLKEVFDIILN